MEQNIIDFCLSVFNTDKDTINRCIKKSNIIIYNGLTCLIADDKYIYYFGRLPGTDRRTVYSDMKNMQKYMAGKLFYSKNIKMYKNHCSVVHGLFGSNGSTTYRWKN